MEDDLTRRAVLKAANRAHSVMDRVSKQIPYGPAKVGIKPAEIRRRFTQMTMEDRTMFMQMLGGPEFTMEFFNATS